MSIAGGLHNACTAGVEVGCDCLQVFVKNQRQWAAPPLTDEAIRTWKRAVRQTGLSPVVAHDSYLINLASPDNAARNKSMDAFIDELTRCEALGIRYLVMHPGAHMGEGEEAGLRRIVGSFNAIHKSTAGYKVRTLLETTAGQGTALGYRFEHLAGILDGVADGERMDVCFDTCHVFAAGYDFRHEDKYEAMVADFDRLIGTRRVKCFHMNDSKRACGSRVDRHDHVGQGKLGRAGFKHIINDRRFARTAKILETPKGEDGKGRSLDRLNLQRMRRMIR
jgi:deoxyribonuclease-4